jgi:methylenetetrahydrofolate--tRNA-(uracil-5-)-methyltransferase
MMIEAVKIIGGGLAGCEAALYLADHDVPVTLYEMRPSCPTPVHQTGKLAELVCSNSLKSTDPNTASGLLKEEMRLLKSHLLEIAEACRLPAGSALAVDRERFSEMVGRRIADSTIRVVREEYTGLDDENYERTAVALCAGPATSDGLMGSISRFLKTSELFFFDAVAPIVDSETIDFSHTFRANRYQEGEEGSYINLPLDEALYARFFRTLVEARTLDVPDFERKYLFERCQPIEEIARAGYDALRYGPMKPVGLIDPKTNREPYAVIQLRQENAAKNLYNLVGFQTRLSWGEQKRLLRLIPALREVEIVRYGVMHRNTYLNTPRLFDAHLESKTCANLFVAGQMSGVEGYMESAVSGRIVAGQILRRIRGQSLLEYPIETMVGALNAYITKADPLRPMYANFGILPPVKGKKKEIRALKSERALRVMKAFLAET